MQRETAGVGAGVARERNNLKSHINFSYDQMFPGFVNINWSTMAFKNQHIYEDPLQTLNVNANGRKTFLSDLSKSVANVHVTPTAATDAASNVPHAPAPGARASSILQDDSCSEFSIRSLIRCSLS